MDFVTINVSGSLIFLNRIWKESFSGFRPPALKYQPEIILLWVRLFSTEIKALIILNKIAKLKAFVILQHVLPENY